MNAQTVLLVDPSDPDGTSLEGRITSDGDREVSVRVLAELRDLFDVLTRSAIHCLVLSATVGDKDAADVVRGVRGLYPDLPVVVAGRPGEASPEGLDATVVENDSPTSDAVAAAVRHEIGGGVDSDAARPPSRMETLMLSMFDQFPLHLYAKDEEGRHVVTSDVNFPPTHMIGQTDLEFDVLSEEHREAAYQDDLSVVESGGQRIEVEEYTGVIDSHTLTSKVPWFDEDGEVVGLAGVTRDITERKKREQAARRQHELLVKVALVAAHELRNELQVASGRLELVDSDADQIDVIADSQARLANIVDKVVELATQEQPHRRTQPLWLSTVTREVWDTLETGDASLTVAEDAHFVADRESMSLFFRILFKNAIQHAGQGVTVTVGTIDGGFYVADDGRGIEAEPPERVFDAGYTTDPDSTGFGLYVARSITDERGWRIELRESEDGGTRFDVVGPTLENEDEPDA